MLPPGLDRLQNPHTYGALSIALLPKLDIRQPLTLSPHFFGSNRALAQTIRNGSELVEFNYEIVTNLWHFYAYLTDCSNIPIYMNDSQGNRFVGNVKF